MPRISQDLSPGLITAISKTLKEQLPSEQVMINIPRKGDALFKIGREQQVNGVIESRKRAR